MSYAAQLSSSLYSRFVLLSRRDSVVEMNHVLYSRIFKYQKMLRNNPEEGEKVKERVARGDYSIFDIDGDCDCERGA